MSTPSSRLNPFVLMLDPEAVIHAMETSANLRGLRQRICRPHFDAVIEAEEFMDSGAELYVEAQPALHTVH